MPHKEHSVLLWVFYHWRILKQVIFKQTFTGWLKCVLVAKKTLCYWKGWLGAGWESEGGMESSHAKLLVRRQIWLDHAGPRSLGVKMCMFIHLENRWPRVRGFHSGAIFGGSSAQCWVPLRKSSISLIIRAWSCFLGSTEEGSPRWLYCFCGLWGPKPGNWIQLRPLMWATGTQLLQPSAAASQGVP